MREIKFRAWDKIDSKMIYENDVDQGAPGFPVLLAIGFHGLPIAIDPDSFKKTEIVGFNLDHNLELMQYTGLKDKNGKEIYEGDIVLVTPDHDDYEPYKTKVRFDGGAFAVDVKGYDYDYTAIGWAIELWTNEGAVWEIIGNVHDLLEESHAK